VLVIPLAFGLMVGFVIGLNAGFSGDLNSLDWDLLGSLTMVELLLVIGAFIAALALVLTAPENETGPVITATSPPATQTPPQVTFPSILTVAEAARYLRVSEAEILQLIDDGRIAAARIGGDYRIARVVLDELLQPDQPDDL
jgi:excisionase family DNA binding protein